MAFRSEQVTSNFTKPINHPQSSPHSQSICHRHYPTDDQKLEARYQDDGHDSPTRKRRAVKRKQGSGNLGRSVKRLEDQNNNPAPARQTSPTLTRQQHPNSAQAAHFPLINSNNIHSVAWDLKPRFSPSTHYPINSQGSYHTSTLGSATLVTHSTHGLHQSGDPDVLMTAEGFPLEAGLDYEQSPFDLQPPSPRRFRFPSPLSDASTPTIPSFPLPPTSWKPQSDESLSPHVEIRKATIYHLRGASFEIINPHQSLYAKNIETPVADREEDRADYFGTPTRKPKMTTKPSLQEHSPSSTPQETVARSTPPRSLFDDLQSAYASITTRAPPKPRTTEQTDPPIKHSASPLHTREDSVSDGADLLTATPTIEPKTPPASSVRKRISDILRLGKQDQHPWRRSRTTPALRPATRSAPRLRSNTLDGAASLMNVPWSFEQDDPDVNHTRGPDVHRPNTEQHNEDDDSFFGFASERQTSASQLPTIFSDQRQHSSRSTNHSQDGSTAAIIASYGDNEHQGSPLSREAASPVRQRRSMPLLSRGSDDAVEGTTSTIGHILDQYRRMNDSGAEPSPSRKPLLGRTASLPASAVLKGTMAKRIGKTTNTAVPAEQREGFPEQGIIQDKRRKDIRSATNRALNAPFGVGPVQPLPNSPSRRVSIPVVGSSNRSSTPSRASYGDTRNLLQLSSTPNEVGRGITSSRSVLNNKHLAGESSDEEDMLSMTSEELNALPTIRRPHLEVEDVDRRRSSSRSLKEVVEKDLRYFSHVSGISQLSGSIFLFDGDEPAAETSTSKFNDFKFTFANDKPTQPATPKQQLFKRATAAGVAAFTPQTVEQGIKRLPMDQRDRLDAAESDASSQCGDRGAPSDGDSAQGDRDDIDWQTVSESRRTLPSRSHLTDGESLADLSSIQSFSTFGNAGPRFADGRYKSFTSTRPISGGLKHDLTPTFAAHADSSSLAPPTRPLYTQYKHPSPLPDSHDNPFISSPPQITGTTADDVDAAPFASSHPKALPSTEAAHCATWMHHNRNLSVIHEQTEHGLSSNLRAGQSTRSNFIHSSSSSVALSDADSCELGSEPGPSISLEAEDGSPMKVQARPASNRLSSGADPALLQKLREDDPRMASSPLSEANSFSKLTRLGPKANVTGSPNGTGMREVGSSVIVSSNPYVPNSSPPVAQTPASATPRAPATALGWSRAKSPLATNDPISPLAGYDRQRWSRSHARGPTPELRSPQSTDGLLSLVTQAKGKAPKRSITGQTRLMQMKLLSNDVLNDMTTTDLRPSHDTEATLKSRGQLLPYAHSHPRLHHRYRSPSSHASGLKQRKQKISWWIFAICALFPYLLILYGHSGLDIIISWLTRGDIHQFGQTQKKVARIAGWTTAGLTVVILIIAFIVIRTVPNDFPR